MKMKMKEEFGKAQYRYFTICANIIDLDAFHCWYYRIDTVPSEQVLYHITVRYHIIPMIYL